MYAADYAANKMVSVHLQTEVDSFLLTLGSEIPLGEKRLFNTIGVLLPQANRYPIQWRFDSRFKPLVFESLRGLRVRIEEMN